MKITDKMRLDFLIEKPTSFWGELRALAVVEAIDRLKPDLAPVFIRAAIDAAITAERRAKNTKGRKGK